MSTVKIQEPDLKLVREIKSLGGDSFKKCFQCATCSAVCQLTPEKTPFPRKEMLLAGWGQADKIMGDPDIWSRHQCNDCTTYCPREAKPAQLVNSLRTYIFKSFAFPKFMGKALSKPGLLPFLLAIPALIIGAMMYAWVVKENGSFSVVTSPEFLSRTVIFNNILHHDWVVFLFVPLNAIVFSFAAIGLIRFWNKLKESNEGESKKGFIPALISTVITIIAHSRFKKCTTTNRNISHRLIFFGFLGAFATTTIVFVFLIMHYLHIPGGMESPIPMSNPVKWLGNASGAVGIVGALMLVVQRIKAGGAYSDWIFLLMLSLVFLTGMSLQYIRLGEMALFAYGTYYIHLILVFFVLCYAPYSKFAHMFYRTLAMTFADSIERKTKI